MKVALVLGSGGARGYAHIGVIEELERRGHEVVTVAGTSMGAVIGGMYASGKLPDFAEWATSLTHLDVLRLYDPALRSPGVIKADRIMDLVTSISGDIRIEDMPIPFTAVATDITNRREIWFQSGPLRTALRASTAIPSFISPIQLHDRLLADGGMVNPVPVEPTLAVPSDVTIAVSLSGRPNVTAAPGLQPESKRSEDESADPGLEHAGGEEDARRYTDDESGDEAGATERSKEARHSMTGRLTRAVTDIFSANALPFWHREAAPAEVDPERPGKLPSGLSTMGVMNMSLDTMQSMIERYRAATNPVTLTIRVPSLVCGTLDFHKASEVIEVGRSLAIDEFDAVGL